MAKSKNKSSLLRFVQQDCSCQLPHSLSTSSCRTRAQTCRSSLALQDKTLALIMPPPQAFDPYGSSSEGLCPNVASTSRIPPGATPNGSGPSNPNPVLVESCSDDHVFKPSDGHDFEHCSIHAQPPLAQ